MIQDIEIHLQCTSLAVSNWHPWWQFKKPLVLDTLHLYDCNLLQVLLSKQPPTHDINTKKLKDEKAHSCVEA